MNILFFIIPKDRITFALSSFSLRQCVEKMEVSGYTSIPIIDDKGKYISTITEGDILRYLKANFDLSLKSAERVNVLNVKIKKEVKSIKIYSNIEDLIDVALEQNFVPVVDDSNTFIGIITRKSIISYFSKNNIKENNSVKQ